MNTTAMALIRVCLLLVVVLVASAQPAAGQATKVYRCGADGRTYSQTPCPAGSAVDVADPRNKNQQREARDLAARQSQLADDLERQRRERDKAAVGQRAVRIGPEAAKAASAPASRPHKGKRKAGSASDASAAAPVQYRATEEKK